MKFTASININRDKDKVIDYVVTANSKRVIGKIIDSFNTGLHSFCLIGSYGTGKSSFLLALQNCLNEKTKGRNVLLKNKGQFNGYSKFKFINVVGEYNSLVEILKPIIDDDSFGDKNFFASLDKVYTKAQSQDEFLVIVIDEFGKILEHAAKNNPEKEMYFLQKFCEYINDTNKNIIFLSTLHQGFTAYAKGLTQEQKQEWTKVKGRIQDIIFKEPVEQLLNLTATRIAEKRETVQSDSAAQLYQLAIKSKFTTTELNENVVNSLYPLDIFSAYILTLANQKYGQNERTLFTFLESKAENSISNFKVENNVLYNLAKVHDYIWYNFHSFLSEANSDSSNWSAIKIAIERIEGLDWSSEDIEKGIALAKVIGLLNIFAKSSTKIDIEFLKQYSNLSMGFADAEKIVAKLEQFKIVRYAKYTSKYILYQGTDVDIEQGLYEASIECKRPEDFVEKLVASFDFRVAVANAYYYNTGTARFFEYKISSTPITKVPNGETDGYLNLLFVHNTEYESIKEQCCNINGVAIAYCLFKNSEAIIDHLFEIDKLIWVRDIYIANEQDAVAHKEIDSLLEYEKSVLNHVVLESIYSNNVEWIFNGEIQQGITSQREVTKFLSKISSTIFHSTPNFKFELINKSRISSTVSSARQSFLMHLVEHFEEENIGFDKDKFPPEKSLYLTLLKQTGMHREDGPLYVLGEPTKEDSFLPIWSESESFLKSSTQKQKKITELYDILKASPFGLKQGFVDTWVPAFLIMKKEDYALYQNDGFIPTINKEVLELMLRRPQDFYIKAFTIEGIKQSFFEKYREAINLKETELTNGSFIETIKPFLTFYNRLNDYAKTTKDITPIAKKFRDIIANAIDPEETFFEKLPDALGFKEIVIQQNPEAINSFVEVIRDAIRCLRSCYDDFVKQVETKILSYLKIKETDFSVYKDIINERFKYVKSDLMPLSVKKFHTRLVSNLKDKQSWIESVCASVLNKPLDKIKDSEKTFMLTDIKDNLFLLEDYVEMHKSDNESVVRLHITQNNGKPIIKQVVMSKEKLQEVESLEEKIKNLFSNDESVNIAALIQLIKKNTK